MDVGFNISIPSKHIYPPCLSFPFPGKEPLMMREGRSSSSSSSLCVLFFSSLGFLVSTSLVFLSCLPPPQSSFPEPQSLKWTVASLCSTGEVFETSSVLLHPFSLTGKETATHFKDCVRSEAENMSQ